MIVLKLFALHLLVLLLLAAAQNNTKDSNKNELNSVARLEEQNSNISVNSQQVIKASIVGFDSRHSSSLFQALLQSKEKIITKSGIVHIFGSSKYLYPCKISANDTIPSDIAFVEVTKSILSSENVLVQKLQMLLQNFCEYGKMKPLFLVVIGDSSQASRMLDDFAVLFHDAWTLTDKFDSKDIGNYVEINMVRLNPATEGISMQTINGLKKLLMSTNASLTLPEIMQGLNFTELPKSQNKAKIFQSLTKEDTVGVGRIAEVLAEVLLHLQKQLSTSLVTMTDKMSREQFRLKVSELIEMNVGLLEQKCREANITNQLLIANAKADITSATLNTMQPIFRKQINRIRKETADMFNVDVGENLQITTKIDKDLKAAKQRALSFFHEQVETLTPKQARNLPSLTWNTDFDELQIKRGIDDFVQEKISYYRIQGVLPRSDRMKLEVWFHTIFYHPLIRDYRQDPVGYRPTQSTDLDLISCRDIPVIRDDIPPKSHLIVSPRIANLAIRKYLNKEHDTPEIDKPMRTRTHRELMRELQMMALSIRDPFIPLTTKQRINKRFDMPMVELDRENHGPERYIRWDLPPLDEARKALDEIPLRPPTRFEWMLGKLFGSPWYIEPPIKYPWGQNNSPNKELFL